MKKHHDKIQAQIEASLLNTIGSELKANIEQLTGATMLRYNIFYDEAKQRVSQALKTLHTGS